MYLSSITCVNYNLLDPPSVVPFPHTGFLEVTLNEEVRMSCRGDGVPYPIVRWYYKVDDKIKLQLKFYIAHIFQGDELKLIDHRELLRFRASNRHLAGTYECTAANGVGEPARAEIELNIICKYLFQLKILAHY